MNMPLNGAVLRGHFDEIAEDIVVLDLEHANARVLGITHLQRRDHASRFIAERAGLIEDLVITFANETAVAFEGRQLSGERGRQFGRQHAIRLAAGLHRGGHLGGFFLEGRKPTGKFSGGQYAVANGGKIARSATADGQSRQRAGKIRRGVQAGARFRARRRIAGKAGDRVEPFCNLRRIGQRGRQPLGEPPRAGCRHCVVDGIEQRAAPVSR
jgi:hypothetical protein